MSKKTIDEIPQDPLKEDASCCETDETFETVSENGMSASEKELEEVKNQMLLLSADYANYKKRVERERSELIARTIPAEALLPIMDNFERAMESSTDVNSNFYQGIVMIHKQILRMLEDNGIKKMEPLGEDFDPKFHDALLMEETDSYDSGKVSGVLQNGYLVRDKVLRTAQVKVAK